MQLSVLSLLVLLAATTRVDAKDSKKKKEAKENYRPSHPPLPNLCMAFGSKPGQQSFDPARYLSSKSPYPIPSDREQQISRVGCKGCKLLHVALVVRHGTRFPGDKDIISWGTELEKLANSQQLPQEFAWMHGFYNPVDLKQASELHQVGFQDLALLAQRDRKRYYPNMENASQEVQRFGMHATSSKRAQDSANSYIQSLFGTGMKPRLDVKPKGSERELRPWDNCPRYDQELSKSIFKWRSKERESRFLQPIASRLSNVFRTEVTKATVMGIYSMCMAQRVLCGVRGQWCSLFTEQEFQVIEWVKDDTYWFKHGPGLKVNREMAANLLSALYDEFKVASKQRSQKPTFSGRFAHAETVVRLADILGMFSQRPIYGNRNRNLLLSRDIPFMANIHLELWSRAPQHQQQQQQQQNGWQQPQQQQNSWQQPQQQQNNWQQNSWQQQQQPQQSWNSGSNWLVRRQWGGQQQQSWGNQNQNQNQWQQQQQQQPWNGNQGQVGNDWSFNPAYNRNQWNPNQANQLDVNDFQDWDEYTGDYSKRKHPNMYVRMLYNERPVTIPGCQDMYCPLDDFIDLHKEVTKQDVKNICKAKH